jgi:hypothetical protein
MEDSINNELTRRMMQYFDHQLNPEDEKEFLLQIKKNPAGNQAFLKEKHIREKLKANIHRPAHTIALGAQIKDKIKKYPGQ